MKRSISDEIADALRGELEGGRYRAGERLPSVDELRRRFGTGEFAVRAALLGTSRNAGYSLSR